MRRKPLNHSVSGASSLGCSLANLNVTAGFAKKFSTQVVLSTPRCNKISNCEKTGLRFAVQFFDETNRISLSAISFESHSRYRSRFHRALQKVPREPMHFCFKYSLASS